MERQRKLKNKKTKDIVTLILLLDFCAFPSKNFSKSVVSGKKDTLSCCRCLLRTLELLWPISSLKISKLSKKCDFGKVPGVNGLNVKVFTIAYYYSQMHCATHALTLHFY